MRSRILFLSTVSPLDQNSWSGIAYHIFRNLQLSQEVEWIGRIELPRWNYWILSLWNFVNDKLRRKFTSQSILNAYFFSRYVANKVRNKKYDFIIAGAGEAELIAFLDTTIPIIYVADATFNRLVNYYPWHTGLCRSALIQGNLIEKKAIQNSWHILYSSEWAANSARNDYGASEDKISIIPFGANIDLVPSSDHLRQKNLEGPLKLLFIGKEWERKGGSIVYKVWQLLKGKGLDCRLVIIGCNPDLAPDENLEIIENLDKNVEADRHLMTYHYSESHFLLLPSLADCTPVVISESAAFGVPVIASDTGGIPFIVHEGVNGYCLPQNSDAADYTTLLEKIWFDKKVYSRLSASSRVQYDTFLNWDLWSSHVERLIAKS